MGNKEILAITAHVPKEAKILIVDMQQSFITNLDVSTEVKRQLLQRVYDMKDALLDLKAKGHEKPTGIPNDFKFLFAKILHTTSK